MLQGEEATGDGKQTGTGKPSQGEVSTKLQLLDPVGSRSINFASQLVSTHQGKVELLRS